jgi:hypothetical protein
VRVTVTYELPADLPEIRTTIKATTDKATPRGWPGFDQGVAGVGYS